MLLEIDDPSFAQNDFEMKLVVEAGLREKKDGRLIKENKKIVFSEITWFCKYSRQKPLA